MVSRKLQGELIVKNLNIWSFIATLTISWKNWNCLELWFFEDFCDLHCLMSLFQISSKSINIEMVFSNSLGWSGVWLVERERSHKFGLKKTISIYSWVSFTAHNLFISASDNKYLDSFPITYIEKSDLLTFQRIKT